MSRDDESRPASPRPAASKPASRKKAVHAQHAASALRDNLRRRKAAARERGDGEDSA